MSASVSNKDLRGIPMPSPFKKTPPDALTFTNTKPLSSASQSSEDARSTLNSPARGYTTPTVLDEIIEDDQPTPVGPRFHIHDGGTDDQDEEEDEENDSLDDDEFESHYSRQESSASASDSDGLEDEDENYSDTDDIPRARSRPRASAPGDSLQRVSSLPASFSNSHLHTSHSSASLRHHHHYAPAIPPPLYPPFYNRPPTTSLPPSPSLTSLLRPPSFLNRSTTSTRPTTPDYSDPEDALGTPNDTEAAVAHSARRATILPSTSPKVPTYEYYGFVLYLASTLVFLLYLMWSYLPSPFLHRIGITYYPNRWWSVAIPAWIVMALVYIYVALACWNVEFLTLGLDKVETMVDEAGNVAILDDMGRVVRGGSKRLERERMEGLVSRRRREKGKGKGKGHGEGGGSIGSNRRNKSSHRSGGKKDRKKKEKDAGDEAGGRYGYMGPVSHGCVANGLTWSQIWNEGTDAVMDIPIGGVCEVLYGGNYDPTGVDSADTGMYQ